MIATSGKHSYKMCVKSTTRKEKLTAKNEDRNVTNANCNSLYMLVTMPRGVRIDQKAGRPRLTQFSHLFSTSFRAWLTTKPNKNTAKVRQMAVAFKTLRL